MRITVACGEALISDANNLAMVLAKSEADNETYRQPTWQDTNGNVYAVTSFEVTEDWVNRAQSPLVRPDWDVNNFIDMDAANRAQAALVFEAFPNIPTAAPTAKPWPNLSTSSARLGRRVPFHPQRWTWRAT